MSSEKDIAHQGIESTRAIAEVVVSALMNVYDSKGEISRENLVVSVNQETHYDTTAIDQVMNSVFNDKNPYLRHSTELGGTIFGIAGLWLIEDAFTHGEATVDSMEVVEANLAKAGFFKFLKSSQAK